MNDPTRLDELVQKHLDGACSPAEFEELQRALVADPQAADAFAQATRLSAALGNIVRGEKEVRTSAARIVELEQARRKWGRFRHWWVAAAALILALIGVRMLPAPLPLSGPQLLSGEVTVGGAVATELHDLEQFTVGETQPARIRFRDGSEAEFTPRSEARLPEATSKGGNEVVLSSGKAHFKLIEKNVSYRILTPRGTVFASGAEFNVELRTARIEKEHAMRTNAALILAVAVFAGSVRVEWNGQSLVLKAGENRVFAEEESTTPSRTNATRPPATSGPSTPPPARTEHEITPSTQPVPPETPRPPQTSTPERTNIVPFRGARTPAEPAKEPAVDTQRNEQPKTPSTPSATSGPAPEQRQSASRTTLQTPGELRQQDQQEIPARVQTAPKPDDVPASTPSRGPQSR